MFAAAYFARDALGYETDYTNLIEEEPYHAHIGCVTGAVFSAVASLEATINELYIDAYDAQGAPSHTFQGIDSKVPRLLAECWEDIENAKVSTLRKYQLALILASKSKFPTGARLYQDVNELIRLRNALVHYKPEWDTDLEEHRKIEGRLEGRFDPNPFVAHTSAAFFPKKCLGHGCAEWAVKSGVAFIEQFFGRLGLPSIFRNHPEELLRTR